MVEFAIVIPVFMLLLLIVADFGRLFFTYIQVNNAAREAAAWGAANPTDPGIPTGTGTILLHATQETDSQSQRGEGAITLAAACADASGNPMTCATAGGGTGAGNTITVNVSRGFSFFTPLIGGLFGSGFHVTASATGVVLDLAPGGGTPPGSCPPPTASFTPTSSGLDLHVDPSASQPDSGICAISGYNWTFGDGSSDVGTAVGTDHTYAVAGTYVVTLEVTNQGGTDTNSQTVVVPKTVVTCTDKPTANFTYTAQGVNVDFTDTSTTSDPINCPITAWSWDFGDGTPTSNAMNPSHKYKHGTYNVTLTVTNDGGSDSKTRTVSP